MTTTVGIGRGYPLSIAAVMNAVDDHLIEHAHEGMAVHDRRGYTAGTARKVSLPTHDHMIPIIGAGRFWPGCLPAHPPSDRLGQPAFCLLCHDLEGGSPW